MAETFRFRLQQAANALLAPAGLHLMRRDRVFDMNGLLARAAARGVVPATIIDIGASDGIWSLRAHRHFPRANYLLFEPLAERGTALARLKASHGFDFVAAAAGAQAGSVAFAVDAGLDGSGVAAPDETGGRMVPLETIDAAVKTRRLNGPYCLKLDTHGYEIPVLSGAAQVLAQTDLLIIEAYNFTLTPGCLRFHELCAWLEPRGFLCCDLADPMRRPTDGALWQMDLAFAPATSPLFASNSYA
jgi:FkbM family methyltransferase